MKWTLLVTLADSSYLDQATQLFSSVYHNAGWRGDYMLLAHEIPERYRKECLKRAREFDTRIFIRKMRSEIGA